MKRIVFITGARRLADTHAAERWARERIREALSRAHDVVTGDAPAVDTWAIEIATDLGIAWTRFCLDGVVRFRDHYAESWAAEGERARFAANRWPLRRNQVAVETFSMTRDAELSALALQCEWATTHGTSHTVTLLRKRGITVIEHTCPLEFKP